MPLVVLKGENGSGKSSALEFLAGFLSEKQLVARINSVPKEILAIKAEHSNLSIVNNTKNPLPPAYMLQNFEQLAKILHDDVKIDYADKSVLQKVMLKQMLNRKNTLILLDEPTSRQRDESTRSILNELAKEAFTTDKTIVLATHAELENCLPKGTLEKVTIIDMGKKITASKRRTKQYRALKLAKQIAKSLLTMSPLIIFTTIVEYLITYSIHSALFLLLRFVLIITIAGLLLHAIKPVALAKILPNRSLKLTVILSLTLIKKFSKHFRDLKKAQQIMGKLPMNGIKSKIPIVLLEPFFIDTIENAENLEVALRFRGIE
ncbi:MAG: ATP-binding cassette domain-containing protein [Bifidobacteriaceae bacterium]|jgi:energy-coupling factor transporter ATP-binding protein EcfA2|nr:ATP-binding cassette domain-containing protein [Bifidobacteriaceae bacterium]